MKQSYRGAACCREVQNKGRPAYKGVCPDHIVVIEETGQVVFIGLVYKQAEGLVPDRVSPVVLDRALQSPMRPHVQPANLHSSLSGRICRFDKINLYSRVPETQ